MHSSSHGPPVMGPGLDLATWVAGRNGLDLPFVLGRKIYILKRRGNVLDQIENPSGGILALLC